MREYTGKVFNDKVAIELANVELEYLKMVNIYAYIASADYYANEILEADILNNLDDANQNGELKDLRDDFLKKMEFVPDFLIDPPLEFTASPSKFRFTWMITAYASDLDADTEAKCLAIFHMINELADKSNGYNDESVGLSNDNLTEGDISSAMIDFIMLQKKLKDSINREKKIEDEKKAIAMLDSYNEYLKDYAIQMATNPHVQIALGSFEQTEQAAQLAQAKEEVDNAIGIEDIENKIKALNGEIINSEQRETIIKNIIENSPDKITVFAANSMLAFGQGDIVYNDILSNFVNMLNNNKGEMSKETFETLNNLLSNDLAVILGDKRDAFSTKVLNGSKEEMVIKFTNWINESGNRNGLKVDINSLILMLNAAGFETEIKAEQVSEQENDESVAEGLMLAEELDGVDLSDYFGNIYLPENSSLFVFYHSNGVISDVQSYSTYNEKYMINYIYQYYDNKQLDYKAVKLVETKFAIEQMNKYESLLKTSTSSPRISSRVNRMNVSISESYHANGHIWAHSEYDMEGNHIFTESYYYSDDTDGYVKKYSKTENFSNGKAEKEVIIYYKSDGTVSSTRYYENGVSVASE
jgi:hypothetical protein